MQYGLDDHLLRLYETLEDALAPGRRTVARQVEHPGQPSARDWSLAGHP